MLAVISGFLFIYIYRSSIPCDTSLIVPVSIGDSIYPLSLLSPLLPDQVQIRQCSSIVTGFDGEISLRCNNGTLVESNSCKGSPCSSLTSVSVQVGTLVKLVSPSITLYSSDTGDASTERVRCTSVNPDYRGSFVLSCTQGVVYVDVAGCSPQWQQSADVLTEGLSQSVTVRLNDGRLLVCGGLSAFGRSNSCFSISEALDGSLSISPFSTPSPWSPRVGHAIAHTVVNDQELLFLIGGFDGKPQKDVWRLSPSPINESVSLVDDRLFKHAGLTTTGWSKHNVGLVSGVVCSETGAARLYPIRFEDKYINAFSFVTSSTNFIVTAELVAGGRVKAEPWQLSSVIHKTSNTSTVLPINITLPPFFVQVHFDWTTNSAVMVVNTTNVTSSVSLSSGEGVKSITFWCGDSSPVEYAGFHVTTPPMQWLRMPDLPLLGQEAAYGGISHFGVVPVGDSSFLLLAPYSVWRWLPVDDSDCAGLKSDCSRVTGLGDCTWNSFRGRWVLNTQHPPWFKASSGTAVLLRTSKQVVFLPGFAGGDFSDQMYFWSSQTADKSRICRNDWVGTWTTQSYGNASYPLRYGAAIVNLDSRDPDRAISRDAIIIVGGFGDSNAAPYVNTALLNDIWCLEFTMNENGGEIASLGLVKLAEDAPMTSRFFASAGKLPSGDKIAIFSGFDVFQRHMTDVWSWAAEEPESLTHRICNSL